MGHTPPALKDTTFVTKAGIKCRKCLRCQTGKLDRELENFGAHAQYLDHLGASLCLLASHSIKAH